MKRLVLALAILSNLALPNFAAAEESDDSYSRSGFFVGLGFPIGINTFSDDIPFRVNLHNIGASGTGIMNGSYDVGAGLDFVFGYRIIPMLAVEFETEWMGAQDFRVEQGAQFSGYDAFTQFILDDFPPYQVGIEPLVGTINAKFYPIQGIFQPYVTVGVGVYTARYSLDYRLTDPNDPFGDDLRLTFKTREVGAAMRFGAGFDYYAHEKIAVGIQASYVLPFGDVEDLSYFSIRIINVTWRF